MLNVLASERSRLFWPGPRAVPSPEFPRTFIAGTENFDVSNWRRIVFWKCPIFGFPDIFSSSNPAPSCALEPVPLGQRLVPASAIEHVVLGPPFSTVSASPDSMVPIPLMRHPANATFAHPGQLLPYSGLQIQL